MIGLSYRSIWHTRFSFLMHLGVAGCLAVGSMAATGQASPVTLEFEAEITDVSPGIPFSSGIDFALGDTVRGVFTYNPSDGDGTNPFSTIQSFGFVLDINGTKLATPSFEMSAFNNTAIFDFPPANVVDTLEIIGRNLAPFDSSQAGELDPTGSSIRIDFLGHDNTINQAEIPGVAEVFNQFDLRRALDVTLRSNSGAVVGFQAMGTEFSVIPEPSCLYLTLFGFAIAIAPYRFRQSLQV